MHELFNPAGLGILEDREGAIAFGFVAPRVFYARIVGSLSAELGTSYVYQLEACTKPVSVFAYLTDASALTQYDLIARTRFERFVSTNRGRFASLSILTWQTGLSPASRAFAQRLGEPIDMLSDPVEFEQKLASLAPSAELPSRHAPQVWHAHAQR